MTGVRPGSRITSIASPSIFRRRAQSVMSPMARSMWPCSAHRASNIGDLAGMRMYSVSAGTMSSSQARWAKARVRSLSMVMDGYSTHPERIALTGGESDDEADRAHSSSGCPRVDIDRDGPGRDRAALRARLWREPGQGPVAVVAGRQRGKPIEFSDNCYLIRHAKGLLLWDTGITDAVAAMPDGLVVANGAIT